MKIEIKNRWSGVVLFELECESLRDAVLKALATGANLRSANLSGAYLSGADLSGANLSGANLRSANLRSADLSGANLSGAYLSGANLSGANLSGADLSGADLRLANLRSADLSGAKIPVIANIDAKILEAITAGGALQMDQWHTCETTHCRAGWAIHLAGEPGRALEVAIGSNAAGALIYAASRPRKPVPNFFTDDDVAMNDIRECAKEA